MNVTVMTDASRDPESGVSGYGGWVVCDRGRRMIGGAFKSPMDSIQAAEAGAIVNIILKAKQIGLVRSGDRLLVQTDCLNALRMLQGQDTPNTPHEKQVVYQFWGTVADHICDLKHVKAHTGRSDSRYRANAYCDKEAKRHMRAFLRKVKPACSGCCGFPAEGGYICDTCGGFG